jgi:hypothetical protein
MDATTPYEWEQKPVQVKLDEDIEKHVLSQRHEYGIE